ncbi:hypothetical protein [Herbidospora mongoliensis]|uniref:hypothetical protein n=1 Tax=Herbidospora mongoliensis TaxID=688067 RepID=UPI000835900F|nr:hypothetical protein [Herbidospora mongoliensis]
MRFPRALIILLLAGCGSEPVAAPTPSPTPSLLATDAAGAADGPMPLDRYVPTARYLADLTLGQDAAIGDCMRERGHPQWVDGTFSTWGVNDFEEVDHVTSLDPGTAARDGYPREAPDPRLVRQKNVRFEHQPSGDQMALADKCFEVARTKIYDPDDLPTDPGELLGNAKNAAWDDPRVTPLVKEWVTCMRDGGHAYTKPIQAVFDERWEPRPAGKPAGREERQVAAADATCRAETGLTETYLRVRRAYEQKALDENREKLDAALKVMRVWRANARAALA